MYYKKHSPLNSRKKTKTRTYTSLRCNSTPILLDPVGSLDNLGILCLCVCLTHISDSTPYIPSLTHQLRLTQVTPSKPNVYDTTTLQHYNTTTLQHYSTTTPQHYNTTTPQHYNITTLQHYNTTTLQNYKTTTLQHYNTNALQHYN